MESGEGREVDRGQAWLYPGPVIDNPLTAMEPDPHSFHTLPTPRNGS